MHLEIDKVLLHFCMHMARITASPPRRDAGPASGDLTANARYPAQRGMTEILDRPKLAVNNSRAEGSKRHAMAAIEGLRRRPLDCLGDCLSDTVPGPAEQPGVLSARLEDGLSVWMLQV